ncbi:unnamed protein product, partial [Phaeothamnion confervicola]
MTAGWLHHVRVEYSKRRGAGGVTLGWATPLDDGYGGYDGYSGYEVVPPARLFWLRELGGSPWQLAVAPAETVAERSDAFGDGLVRATAGERAWF